MFCSYVSAHTIFDEVQNFLAVRLNTHSLLHNQCHLSQMSASLHSCHTLLMTTIYPIDLLLEDHLLLQSLLACLPPAQQWPCLRHCTVRDWLAHLWYLLLPDALKENTVCLIGLAMSMVMIVTWLSKWEMPIVLDDGVTWFRNWVPLIETMNWSWHP